MGKKVSVDALADAVMEGIQAYGELTNEKVKKAVRKAGRTVREQINKTAPERTGAYAKSWSVKNMKETTHSLTVTVHSRNRYQLTHLLEHGHAKRNGGRVAARPHIAAAEQVGEKIMTKEIESALR